MATVVCLVILFGYLGLHGLPLQLLPDISEPRISIYNNWRSAAPQELEEAIIQPQEEVLRSNAGLTEVVSNTSRGGGSIDLVYQAGHDMQSALLDVISRLNQAPALPADAGEPYISSGGGGGLPGAASILVYAGPGNPVRDMVAYQDLIEEVVEPRLARIPGVARVNLQGRRPREVNVRVDPLRAAMLGIQISDIAAAMDRARDISGGFADVGRRRFTVRFLGEQEFQRFEALVVGWRNGQPIYLRDVATVDVDYTERQNITLRNGFPSFYLSVSRRNEANTVELLDALNQTIAELNAGPLKAANLIAELSFDASLHIRRAIALVETNLLLGVFLATLVLFFFLRNVKATLAILVAVPVSLASAFIVLDLLNLTLNVVSLAGLAFAVGLVMDAAIIAQENIYRLRQSGLNTNRAVIEGCKQVSGALFSSTLTTVAIFLPILFMVGVEGQLFRDLAVTISVSVIASLVSALTVLPALSSGWLKTNIAPDRFGSSWEWLSDVVIRATSSPALRVTWIVGILAMALLAIWLLIPKLDFLPRAHVDGIYVSFDVPAGTNVKTIEEELSSEVVRRLEPYYQGIKSPEIKSYNFATFNGFGNQVYIYPRKPDEVEELMDLLRNQIFIDLPGIDVNVSRSSMLRVNGGNGRSINVDIQGSDLERLMMAAKAGREVIVGLWENTNVSGRSGLALNEPELQVIPDDRRINMAGLDRSAVGAAIRAYTGGLFAGEYFDGNRRLDMIIRAQPWESPDELLEMPIATPAAGVQMIGDLVDIRRTVGPGNLRRVDGRRTVTLNVTPPDHVTLEEALERLSAEVSPVIISNLPESGSVQYRGNADRLKQALGEALKNFALAIIILFMVMAVLFRSARDSFFVLLVMPIAMAGGLAALRLLNLFVFQSLDMLTMVGFIILLGLVVNNAILLIDQTRRGENDGMNKTDAVRRAVRFRARPIFMSSLTSIVGMMPLVLIPGVGSEIYRGLAAVIVGGMMMTVLFTLVLLPSLMRTEWLKGRIFGRLSVMTSREAQGEY